MPNWDEDSSQSHENLARVLREIVATSQLRNPPSLEAAKRWQTFFMQGLDVPDPRYVEDPQD